MILMSRKYYVWYLVFKNNSLALILLTQVAAFQITVHVHGT